MTGPPFILFASIRVLIDSGPPKCECNMGMRPITKFLFKLIYNGNIFPAFRKVIPSLSYSETEVIKALGIRDCAFRNFVDYTKNMVVGDFRGNLGIHPIKAFSGDWLLWFGHKIEIPFNYHNIFLLKKQNQYASKSNCVKFLYLQYSYIFTPLRAYKRVHNHWTKNLL